MVREKARISASQNDYPHNLSRGGYSLLNEKLLTQGLERLRADAIATGSDPDTITQEMVKPPTRAEQWKLAHIHRGTGEYMSQKNQEVGERAVSPFKLLINLIKVYSSKSIKHKI